MPVEELRSLLSAAVSEGEPPVGAGPAAVFARAQRLRRLRRIAMASGIAGIVAAAGVIASVLVPTWPAQLDQNYDLALLAQPPTGVVTSDSPALALVMSLIPAGLEVSGASETAPDEFPGVRGQMVLADPSGQTTLVYVVVEEGDLGPYLRCGRGESTCEPIATGDGLPQVRRQYRYPGDRIATCVDVQRSAHLLVGVCAMNAFPVRGQAPGPVTRATPVLSFDQLMAIATDPHWSKS